MEPVLGKEVNAKNPAHADGDYNLRMHPNCIHFVLVHSTTTQVSSGMYMLFTSFSLQLNESQHTPLPLTQHTRSYECTSLTSPYS